MKNKRILALLALTISASVFMSACSFFGGDEPEESVAVTVTPTPVATETPARAATSISVLLILLQTRQWRSTFRMLPGLISPTKQICSVLNHRSREAFWSFMDRGQIPCLLQ